MGTIHPRRFLLPLLAAFALLVVLAQGAFADPRDFTLRNRSDIDIAYVYVSPSNENDWGDDVMGDDVLFASDSVDISFDSFDGSTCVYDIKVVGVGGEEGYLYKVNLCSVSVVTFR